MKVNSSIKVKLSNETVIVLRENLPKIMNQNFWQHKIPITEKIAYLRELANAKKDLWESVEEQIPSIKGNSYIVSSVSIEYEDDKKLNNPDEK